MNSGTIVTVIIATIILGYGAFALMQIIKKTKKGECIGCDPSTSGCSGSCNYKKNEIK